MPVNRSFDNYPSGPATTLGQQELQVYTGSAPATAEAQGLAGFINQVIKVGSYPGFANASVGIGSPAFYHQAGLEIGGATKNRNFSYFFGTNGYDQDFRYADQYQGASLSNLYGTPLAPCSATVSPQAAPSCFNAAGKSYAVGVVNPLGPAAYVLGPYDAFSTGQVKDRDDVFNLHFGLPHKDGTKDGIQLLGEENFVSTQYYDSTNDQGGVATLANNGLGVPSFSDGFQYSGATGVPLPSNYRSLTSTYLFPGVRSPEIPVDGEIQPDLRDAISNDQGILKAQFTKSLGANALLKVYGYTFYSDWLQVGPQTSYADYEGPAGPDYELSSHTRGVSGNFEDQIGSKNLFQIQGSYTTSTSLRDNNTQFYNGSSTVGNRSAFAVLVDSKDPLGGLCYTAQATPTTCSYDGNAQFATISQAAAGTIAPVPAATCGTGACEYLVTNNGQYATYNQVKPKFTSASITDQLRATDKLLINAGLRLDVFQFQGSDTTGSAARTFWYNAFNLDKCLDAAGNLYDKVTDLDLATPAAACPKNYTAANFVNPTGIPTQTFPEFQPRLGMTYSINPTTVVRASYGRYAQAPNSAYEQYNALQQNTPALLYGTYGFQKFGFTSPDHTVYPSVSNNYDLSLEKSFGDTALKITPFYRSTQNQIQQFFLNQQTDFVSGLNVGQQTSDGVEFELDKGNFGRNGLAAKLSFTYTNSYIRYTDLPNGSTIIDPINAGIKQYNAYTSFCATHAGNAQCGTTPTGKVAAPCYTPLGVAVAAAAACTLADVANPYWDAPVQGLIDPNQNFHTFDIFPGGIGSAVQGYGAPYFATFLLQYKHGPFAFVPNVQFSAGQRYGAPQTSFGVEPDTCKSLGVTATGDPRYTSGSPGGGGFDATSCTGQLLDGIPEPYTGKFDSIGEFVAPSEVQLGAQIEYDLNKNVSLLANLGNIVNTCFGGTKTSFAVRGACNYTVVGNGTGGDVGNSYNPGAAIQPYVNTPYEPTFAGYPFSLSVSAKIHL